MGVTFMNERKLKKLRAKHEALEAKITAMSRHPNKDLERAELKREKLKLKDEITTLVNEMENKDEVDTSPLTAPA